MIKTLGWLTVIGVGLYTGILQMMLVMVGAAIVTIAELLFGLALHLGGAL